MLILRASGLIPALLGALLGPASSQELPLPLPSWTREIGPLVHRACSHCHRPGQAAPFALLTYRDVQKRGPMVADVVEDGFMPPWHPSPDGPRYQDERRLADSEIAALVRWVEGGMPHGPGELDPPTYPTGYELGEPDLVVEMQDAFEVPASGPDIYRNFLVPLGLDEDRWVTAIELLPSARPVVHHVLFHLDGSGNARRRDGRDGRPGFSGMGGIERREAFGGWAVGQTARHLPEGFAVRIPAGSDLVLATHFHPSGKIEREKTRVALYFADETAPRAFESFMLPPLYGALSGLDIPAGDADYRLEDRFELPVDVEVHHVWAHAHMVCASVRAAATKPDGTEILLLDVPRWDFNWQDRYALEEPVVLPAGSVLEVVIRYDNSAENPSNPFDPPRRVRWGRESTDEMGAVVFGGAVVDPSTQGTLVRALGEHARRVAAGRARGRDEEPISAGQLTGLRRLDRNGDGFIESDEVPPRFGQLFLAMDRDGDGKVRIDELEGRRR